MIYEVYVHRFADVILNSDYKVKKEIEEVVQSINYSDAATRYDQENAAKQQQGKKPSVGRQSTLNSIFKEQFEKRGWGSPENIFDDPLNDLTMDFLKGRVGLDVAFNHRSFIWGHLVRFQAAAEVKKIIDVGVYICPTKDLCQGRNAQVRVFNGDIRENTVVSR